MRETASIKRRAGLKTSVDGKRARAFVLTGLAIVTATFLAARCVFFDEGFCGAIAIITVAMSIDGLFIYLIPIIWLAMYSSGATIGIWSNFWAVVIVGLIGAFIGKKRMTMVQRSVISFCAYIIASCGYYIYTEKVYMFDIQLMLKELALIGVLIYLINVVAKGITCKKDSVPTSYLAISLCFLAVGSGQALVALGMGVLVLSVVIQWEKSSVALETSIGLGLYMLTAFHESNTVSIFTYIIIATAASILVAPRVPGVIRRPVIAVIFGMGLWLVPDLSRYFILIVCGITAIVPEGNLMFLWIKIKSLVGDVKEDPKIATVTDLKKQLEESRDQFGKLGNMFKEIGGDTQVISYQFTAMERIIGDTMARLFSENDKLVSLPVVKVKVGWEAYGAGGISGDSFLCKSLKCGKTILLISDGMGKGSQAAYESKLVVDTISHLIEAGVEIDLAIKTVNNTLLREEGEGFATVDLAVIDEIKGVCKFYKMGAAATLIKRKSKVAAIQKPSLPAGIKGLMRLEPLTVKVKNGDIIVMISDGIMDCDHLDDNANWLKERLVNLNTRDPETIAHLIVNKAIEKYGIKERDDLTVLVGSVYS